MNRVGFRSRLLVILLAFAVVPSIVLSVAWGATSWWALQLVGATAAWDSVAASGSRALAAARTAPLTPDQHRAFAEHERVLSTNLTRARQASFIYRRAPGIAAAAAIVAFLLLLVITSRVAGHLSRNLSRPLQELVGWTERIGRGEPLPQGPPRRGAPEFEVLRQRMRAMARELELGRARAIESERVTVLRESARRVAHELKNPLTPIRFAVERLRRELDGQPPAVAESIDVLDVESRRLEEMARSFAQFGRLPEGPQAEIDVGELVRYTARSSVPAEIPLAIEVAQTVPMIHGHHDALARALANVMLNAVDACRSKNNGGSVTVRVSPVSTDGSNAVEIAVADTGCGIPPEQLGRIWDPYVTSKPSGTGLGLAIARQTVVAHRGTVDALSTPGGGTTIRFILPVDGRPEEVAHGS